jgi:hypothetical protein
VKKLLVVCETHKIEYYITNSNKKVCSRHFRQSWVCFPLCFLSVVTLTCRAGNVFFRAACERFTSLAHDVDWHVSWGLGFISVTLQYSFYLLSAHSVGFFESLSLLSDHVVVLYFCATGLLISNFLYYFAFDKYESFILSRILFCIAMLFTNPVVVYLEQNSFAI